MQSWKMHWTARSIEPVLIGARGGLEASAAMAPKKACKGTLQIASFAFAVSGAQRGQSGGKAAESQGSMGVEHRNSCALCTVDSMLRRRALQPLRPRSLQKKRRK